MFNSLAENGTVQMPFQKTFWATEFGVLTKEFGVPWEINYEQAATSVVLIALGHCSC